MFSSVYLSLIKTIYAMLVKLLVLFLVILLVINTVLLTNESCDKISSICLEEKNCRDCIRAHHCCVWCYDESFTESRCISKEANETLKKCGSSFIENNHATKVEVTKNVSFTDVEEDVTEAVQMSPSEYSIDLRHGEPVNISLQYRPAKDYPLDLYYLMDLTMTMQPDLDTLRELGSELTGLLTELSKNHRIAFGSYIDKPEMPFYRTDPFNYENPCISENRICEKGYLFKHKLNFTDDIEMFIKEVNQSKVSANTDNLEGGMDALMQIILCAEKLGWYNDSRKLVIIATDGGMHFAGDGILAGYTRRNTNDCWIDDSANYSPSTHYDYPSLEEVYHQLKDKKINMIVAAKSSIVNYYNKMAELLKETIYVGELKSDDRTVLNLVKEGYYAFIKQVNLFIDTSHIDGLKVDFFADCNGDGRWEKKDSCSNAEVGKVMNFKAQFLLTQYQDKDKEELYVEERNINDKIKINLNFVGSNCDCTSLSQKPTKTCGHGEIICGDCVCYDTWAGTDCNNECKNNISLCRFEDDGVLSLSCSGRGECICSKCICDAPHFKGKYCEFNCPYERTTGQICGGHGDCINGVCVCHSQYSGDSCSCHESQEGCTVPGSENICNDHGECKCNKCKCRKGYSGQYCEYCDQCTGLCTNYEPNVVNHVVHKKEDTGTVHVAIVEDLPQEERSCVYRYDSEDGKKCDIFYKYTINENRTVDIKATQPNCNAPLTAGFYVLVILGAFLVLAALIIIVWKGRNMYRDKIEYQKFVRDQQNAYSSEQNPLYKNPVTTYRNPMELSTMHSKDD